MTRETGTSVRASDYLQSLPLWPDETLRTVMLEVARRLEAEIDLLRSVRPVDGD
jgi:hypothetical protein